ncbi:hypothetical protein TRIUR3_13592 [Triticum urartu]|uniref:DUF2062 domain-containing protein n=1 Tax=Triticum urartu TaxID=4572 RepID=M7ZGY1_TRIUA|nr:hypothetical protein TRIUR3_13592 [Triticum urartu]
MAVVLAWLNARVVDPLLQVIQRGAEPKQLAFSAALGVTIGVFPICGTTVIIGGLAVAMLGARCNAVTVMVLNLAATPLELSLIIPFLRLGEIVTGGEHFPLTSDAFKMVLTGHASKDVLLSIFHAILGWMVAAPFVMAGLYTLSVPCFKYLVGSNMEHLQCTGVWTSLTCVSEAVPCCTLFWSNNHAMTTLRILEQQPCFESSCFVDRSVLRKHVNPLSNSPLRKSFCISM